jgi:hypothetical protein
MSSLAVYAANDARPTIFSAVDCGYDAPANREPAADKILYRVGDEAERGRARKVEDEDDVVQVQAERGQLARIEHRAHELHPCFWSALSSCDRRTHAYRHDARRPPNVPRVALDVVHPEHDVARTELFALDTVARVEHAVKEGALALRGADGAVREELDGLRGGEPERGEVRHRRAFAAEETQQSKSPSFIS